MRVRTVILLTFVIASLSTPSQAADGRRCGTGLYAGKNTSSALAKALLRKVGRDTENIGDGARVPVRSPVNGKTYRGVSQHAGPVGKKWGRERRPEALSSDLQRPVA